MSSKWDNVAGRSVAAKGCFHRIGVKLDGSRAFLVDIGLR
jgi:hypothetical protein